MSMCIENLVSMSSLNDTEQHSILATERAIALSPKVLAKLLDSGVLSASEIRPLNNATKLQIKHQCLKGCQGKMCAQCVFQKSCEFKGR